MASMTTFHFSSNAHSKNRYMLLDHVNALLCHANSFTAADWTTLGITRLFPLAALNLPSPSTVVAKHGSGSLSDISGSLSSLRQERHHPSWHVSASWFSGPFRAQNQQSFTELDFIIHTCVASLFFSSRTLTCETTGIG